MRSFLYRENNNLNYFYSYTVSKYYKTVKKSCKLYANVQLLAETCLL